MSKCMDCGKPMDRIDAQTYENCYTCRRTKGSQRIRTFEDRRFYTPNELPIPITEPKDNDI